MLRFSAQHVLKSSAKLLTNSLIYKCFSLPKPPYNHLKTRFLPSTLFIRPLRALLRSEKISLLNIFNICYFRLTAPFAGCYSFVTKSSFWSLSSQSCPFFTQNAVSTRPFSQNYHYICTIQPPRCLLLLCAIASLRG